MNITPLLQRERVLAWSGILVAAILAGGVCWWVADDGSAAAAATAASQEMDKVKGPVLLSDRLREQKQANQELADSIDALRQGNGFTIGRDFLVPEKNEQPGQYFNERLLIVQDSLRAKAKDRNIVYQERLGFERVVKVPPAEEAEHLLIMLQLTERAASAVIDTPASIKPVDSFAISQPTKGPELTGAAGRPPLLREYPLKITLRAKLPTLLWILHRLAQVDGPGGYPLIVRKLDISSKNLDPKDEVHSLDAVLEVAGMRFLEADERATAGKPAAKARSAGLGGAK